MKSLIFLSIILINTACATTSLSKPASEIVAPFDGTKFQNLDPIVDKSFFQVLRWRLGRIFSGKAWPDNVKQQFFKVTDERSKDLKISVINHSTVLIQMNDINIISDPHYSERASPFSWVGPKRVIQPGIAFENLPPIDAVIISHNHYDHLDLPTLKKISKKFKSKFYVGLGNKKLLEKEGFTNVVEMDWWSFEKMGSIDIQFVPVQHWSARGLYDKRETLWGGFVLDGIKKVFFAGDTGYGKVFKEIQRRRGDMDLSLIPIGAYEPREFMKDSHINPEESVKVFNDLKTKMAIGIHFGTFKNLTDEAYDQPQKDLYRELLKEEIAQDRFIVPEFGRAYKIDK